MKTTFRKTFCPGIAAALALVGLAASMATAFAKEPLPAATILQLETVREATARFHDEQVAFAEGYVDIGLFVPHMGWHYLKPDLLDGEFVAEEPELLVYADEPCGGRRLVAVEYAVPVELSPKAPNGFPGQADGWVVNQEFQLWVLHAWIWEYNPDGVFAHHNPRVH
jgi:hypothetical protein